MNQPAPQNSNSIQLSEVTDFNRSQIAIIKNTVAKGTTDLELAYFLSVAKSVGLNPFTKEIWCYKDNRGNVISFAGRAGFQRLLQESPRFVSLNSMVVCQGDEFSISTDDDGEMKINHKITNPGKRGPVIGGYAVIKLKDGGKVIEYADLQSVTRNTPTWKNETAEMMKKTVEIRAAKKVVNISGVYAEGEMSVMDGKVVDAGHNDPQQGADAASQLMGAAEAPKTITAAQIEQIRKILAFKHRDEVGMCAFFKLAKIEDATYEKADEIIEYLKQVPAKEPEEHKKKDSDNKNTPPEVIDGNVVEEAPPPVEEMDAPDTKPSKATSPSNNVKEAIQPIPAEVAQYINEIKEHMEYDQMPDDLKQLIDDTNTGAYKGMHAYPTLKNEMAFRRKSSEAAENV